MARCCLPKQLAICCLIWSHLTAEVCAQVPYNMLGSRWCQLLVRSSTDAEITTHSCSFRNAVNIWSSLIAECAHRCLMTPSSGANGASCLSGHHQMLKTACSDCFINVNASSSLIAEFAHRCLMTCLWEQMVRTAWSGHNYRQSCPAVMCAAYGTRECTPLEE